MVLSQRNVVSRQWLIQSAGSPRHGHAPSQQVWRDLRVLTGRPLSRGVLCSDLKPAVELSVECFFNGGTRIACTTVGEPVQLRAPPLAEGDEEEGAAEDDGASPEERLSQLVDRTIENVNTVVGLI
jgi:hypothetical protein